MSEKKMYDVKCTECGKDTTVPFEPTKGKPVYCKSCFSKRRGKSRERPRREPIMFNMKNAWASRGK
ncbi:MAG: hypothetical protein P8X87_02635 [Candidatus Bathyarchaeota archaeon]